MSPHRRAVPRRCSGGGLLRLDGLCPGIRLLPEPCQRDDVHWSCTAGLPHGNAVGFKDATTESELALMSALSQQPVFAAIEADQSFSPLVRDRCDHSNTRTSPFANGTRQGVQQPVSIDIEADWSFVPIVQDRSDHSHV